MVLLERQIKKLLYKHTITSLKNVDPAKVLDLSGRDAISTFNRAQKNFPYYRSYLKIQGLNGTATRSLDDFRTTVPIINKEKLYGEIAPDISLFEQAHVHRIQSILLSSGSSGTFSFGINTDHEVRSNTQFLDILLHYYFHILNKQTLVINCLAQAVKLPNISAITVEIGPRSDALAYLLRTISPRFEQTIVIGDNYFVKNALEDAREHGIPIETLHIHLILGGIYLPEYLRSYLAELLGIDLEDQGTGSIISSMGISEFGLNLFFETRETILLRKLVKTNDPLRKELIGPELPHYTPMFFNYFPQAFFVEEIDHHMVITSLNPHIKMPLIRYNTKDTGIIVPYERLEGILRKYDATHLLPPFRSPLVLMYGKNEWADIGGHAVYPQQIQKGLYSNTDVAGAITGNFRVIPDEHTDHAPHGEIHVQLKKGVLSTPELHKKVGHAAVKFIPMAPRVSLHSHYDFPYGLELDYNRKFQYI